MQNASMTEIPETSIDHPSKDECSMATLAYVLAIFTGWLGPLLIWLVKKDQSAFVNDQGREVLNFQITMFIAYVVCLLLGIVMIGFFILPVVLIFALIFTIKGALAASKGRAYRFPFAIRLLK